MLEQWWVMLDKALDAHPKAWQDYTKQDIYNRLQSGYLQLWYFEEDKTPKLMIMTQKVTLPTRRELQIIWSSGQFSHFVEYANWAFDKCMDAMDCDCISILTPRFGWEKRLARHGFRKTHVKLLRWHKAETIQ